jgi:hypothetical protein
VPPVDSCSASASFSRKMSPRDTGSAMSDRASVASSQLQSSDTVEPDCRANATRPEFPASVASLPMCRCQAACRGPSGRAGPRALRQKGPVVPARACNRHLQISPGVGGHGQVRDGGPRQVPRHHGIEGRGRTPPPQTPARNPRA